MSSSKLKNSSHSLSSQVSLTSPQQPAALAVAVSPTASAAAGRTEALKLANQSLLRLIKLVQEWNINLSELGESALTLDAFSNRILYSLAN